MAKRRTRSNRRDLATLVMMLLPGFMFVGFFAPAAVKVKPKMQEEIGPISFRNFAPRRPIQFALVQAQKMVAGPGLEPLFAGARLNGEARSGLAVDVASAGDIAAVHDVAAASDGDNEIVLNDDNVQNYVAETLFEAEIEGVAPQLIADMSSAWDSRLFDVIPDPVDRTAFTMWDDFHGNNIRFPVGPPPTNVIPEPATGALLVVGLAALALRRRAQ